MLAQACFTEPVRIEDTESTSRATWPIVSPGFTEPVRIEDTERPDRLDALVWALSFTEPVRIEDTERSTAKSVIVPVGSVSPNRSASRTLKELLLCYT